MEILLSGVLGVGLLLGLGLLWSPPGTDVAGTPRRTRSEPAEADHTTVEVGLFTLPVVQRRLDALTAELDRLDRDPEIFARAFHIYVVHAARQALLTDASRLAHEPPRSPAGPILELELLGSSIGRREVLDV